MERNWENIIIGYLEGTATPSEKEALLAWLESSIENRKVFLSYYDTWSASQQLNIQPENAYKLMRQSAGASWRRHLLTYSGIAATILLLLGIGFYFYQSRPQTDIRHYITQNVVQLQDGKNVQLALSPTQVISVDDKMAYVSYDDKGRVQLNHFSQSVPQGSSYNLLSVPYGKRGLLTLEDGTRIWLKSGTKLTYPTRFDGSKREVYVDGEIFLHVAHDASRPFYVRTKKVNVRVTGTQFDVCAYADEPSTKVVLAQGAVRVSKLGKENEECELSPNQMYSLSASRGVSVIHVDAAALTAWVNNILVCDNEPMDMVLKELRNYYGVKIGCAPNVSPMLCCGKLDLTQPLLTVLQGLTYVLPIRCLQTSDGSYYLKKR
jgi:ferric-dicitrate binding protein FerR (iron transport regulator)